MADRNGEALQVGDVVEIVNMDDPAYKYLEGVRGVVHMIPEEAAETQVFIVLDHKSVPAISTHQAWVAKVE